MARRKIERFDDIKTEKDVVRWLRWLEKTESPLQHYEANQIAERFAADFAYEDRWFSGDDYAQDLASISNWRSWKREFEDTEGKNWWKVRGPAVLVRKKDREGNDTPEWEAIQGLENYPIFDENDHSDLEQETQVKDWADYGRADLRNEIDRRAGFLDRDAIEELMNSVTDEMLDELAHEYYETSGHYPEIEGTSTNFPNALENWDGTLMQLGELLALSRHGYVVEITLSRAAFDQNGRIVLRKQDLPDKVASLVNHPDPVRAKYTANLCDNPYLTCRWTGAKEIADRQKKHDEDVGQTRLPIEERRRKHARRHAR